MVAVQSLRARALAARLRRRTPRIIHYCWFGGPESPEMDRCLATWARSNPGYLVQRWDESNTPRTPFVDAALEQRRFNVAANYVRFAVLNRWGGIYLDTDVEVLKGFDPLLEMECFLAFQYEPDGTSYKPGGLIVNGAVIGARARHPFVADMLERFPAHPDEQDPRVPHGPRMITEALTERGLRGYSNDPITIDGVTILPKESFYPYFWREEFRRELMTADTFAVHHWAKRW